MSTGIKLKGLKIKPSVFLLLFFLLIVLAPQAFSKDPLVLTHADWEQDKAILKTLSNGDPESCEKTFQILWDWSKKGNLEARYSLLVLMTIVHGPNMLLPGPSYDYLNQRRYQITLSIHSIGLNLNREDAEYIDGFYSGVKGLGPDSEFGKCMSNKRSQKCVNLAIKRGSVPSFESFAQEIDTFINAGFKAQCLGVNRNASLPKFQLDADDRENEK